MRPFCKTNLPSPNFAALRLCVKIATRPPTSASPPPSVYPYGALYAKQSALAVSAFKQKAKRPKQSVKAKHPSPRLSRLRALSAKQSALADSAFKQKAKRQSKAPQAKRPL